MQVTGGLLRFVRRSENGDNMFFAMESQRERKHWVALGSEGGRPSGMVWNRKSGNPSKESPAPMDLMKRLWLNSVFTKVM